MALTATAGLLGLTGALTIGLAWSLRRYGEVCEELARCQRGEIDLDPVFGHLEGALDELAVAGGVRRSSRRARYADRPALRVLP